MNRIPQLKPRELVRVLETLGFVFVRQKGSHAFYRNSRTGKTTIVPIHSGQDIDRTLLRGILKEIEVSVKEFLEAFENL